MVNEPYTSEERMKFAASAEIGEVYAELGTRSEGLTQEEANASRVEHGSNSVSAKDHHAAVRRFTRAFLNVFALALFCYAFLDVILCGLDVYVGGGPVRFLVDGFMDDWIFVTIIVSLILISGCVTFIQDTRNTKVADRLVSMVSTTITVLRDGEEAEIDSADLVVGDIIIMDSGDLIPADVRIVGSNHLKVDQSALTGESDEVKKDAKTVGYPRSIIECPDLAFMGTVITGGSAVAVVVNVGNDTVFGQMAGTISSKRPRTAYDRGTASVVKLLLKIMLLMIPPVVAIMIVKQLMINDWSFSASVILEPVKYSVALAVGLMPEMLSTIITANLAKGAMAMAKRKVIVKDMTSVQSLGSIDILCSDKTGTLTQNKISVRSCVDLYGNPSSKVELMASLNSGNLTSTTNQIDWAVDEFAAGRENITEAMEGYEFVSDIPFDFVRRRATVVMMRASDRMQFVITKGAIPEILAISPSFMDENGGIQPMDRDMENSILGLVEYYSLRGMRVLGVTMKPIADGSQITTADETDLVFMGMIVFTDPVKPSAGPAIRSMAEYGISVKVLTGDNEYVTRHVCEEIDLAGGDVVIGADIDRMDDAELREAVEASSIFARLTPDNKSRIVGALR